MLLYLYFNIARINQMRFVFPKSLVFIYSVIAVDEEMLKPKGK